MEKKFFRNLKTAHLFIAIALLIAMASLTSCGKPEDTPAKLIKYNFNAIPQKALWLDVAKSRFIVAGSFQVDTNKLKEIIETESGYLNFTLSIDSVLKRRTSNKRIKYCKIYF